MMLIIAHGLPVLHRGVIAPSTPLDLFLFTHLIVTVRLYVFIVAILNPHVWGRFSGHFWRT